MNRAPWILVALVAVGACAADEPADDASPSGDEGSAVIVTTTTPATTTGGADDATTTASPSTSPATTTTEDSAAPPTTTIATSTTTTTTITTTITTTTTVPIVGDPVVDSEVVGRFDRPVDLAVRPGDEALYIVEQPGRVVRFDGTDSRVVADLTAPVDSGGERGLLGLAFSPDGSAAYLDYTGTSRDTVIAEYPVAADGTLDLGSGRILLTVEQPYGNHNAGDLAIGPDGMLYIPLGDGGSADDPERRASDPRSWLGSLLRIDPQPSADRPYTIPPDNPFATGELDGVAGAPEVWAWGLRNPWKIAFDRVSDELWIADVGQNEFEEVNLVGPTDGAPPARAANFGWSAFEGTERFNTDVADPGDTVLPVLTYPHGRDGCSISGGVPYRGSAIPQLEPAFVYSDYCSGIVWALDLAGGRNLTLLDGFDAVTAVRAGPDGELYVLEHGGDVHRIVAG